MLFSISILSFVSTVVCLAEPYDLAVAAIKMMRGFVHPALEYKRGQFGPGLFTKRALDADTELLVIPRKAAIDKRSVLKVFDALEDYVENPDELVHNGDGAFIALYLATEPDPDDEPAMYMMPGDCLSVATFDAPTVRNLTLSTYAFSEAYNESMAMFREDYDKLNGIADVESRGVTFDAYLLAMCWVQSRGYQAGGASGEDSVVMPLGDLFNHQRDFAVGYAFDPKRDAFVFVTNREHAADSELFISYGDYKSNFDFMFNMGFVVPESTPNDEVFVRLAATDGDTESDTENSNGNDDEWLRISAATRKFDDAAVDVIVAQVKQDVADAQRRLATAITHASVARLQRAIDIEQRGDVANPTLVVIGQFLRAEANLIADAARELSVLLSKLSLNKEGGEESAGAKENSARDEL